MSLTYKSLISSVITDFNSIQTALHTKMSNVVSQPDNSKTSTLIPTSELSGYIKRYLVYPTGTLAITGAGTFDVVGEVPSDGSSRSGVAQVTVAAAELHALSGAQEGTGLSATYKVSSSLKTAGWIAGDDRTFTIEAATFEVSANQVKSVDAGYIAAGQVLGSITAATYNTGTGSATFTEQTADISNMVNISSSALVRDSAPTSANGKYFYHIKSTGTAHGTIANAGYAPAGTATGDVTISGDAYVVIDEYENNSTNAVASVSIVTTDGDAAGKNVSAIVKGTPTTAEPESGYYLSFKADGTAGSANITKSGFITKDTTLPVSVTPETKFFSLTEAALKNSATSGRNYTENTSDNTVLVSNGYLYIDAGYIPDTKISLAHLIPDFENSSEMTSANAKFMLSGYKAYDEAGNVITGSMTTLAPSKDYFTTDTNLGVASAVITGENYVDQTYYVIAGSVQAPAAITGNSATFTVDDDGTIRGVKDVSVTPKLTKAGWISSETASNSTVTLNGKLDRTNLAAGAGACAITNVNTSPTASGGNAKISDNVTGDYVVVRATGSGTVTVGRGWITAGSLSSAEGSDTAKIAASIGTSLSTEVGGSGSIGGATTFTKGINDAACTIAAAGSKTAKITASGNSTTDSVKDKYVIGDVAVSASGEVIVSLDTEATGENVDKALLALCNRLCGHAYSTADIS